VFELQFVGAIQQQSVHPVELRYDGVSRLAMTPSLRGKIEANRQSLTIIIGGSSGAKMDVSDSENDNRLRRDGSKTTA